ncbi:hypothetical protein ACH5RR_033451 [Cinchona calisaya]|uniref:Uncharacterized protein n=1 Tax=Cinchona calisaya TaxID=153742 RepID=A0ABD2YN63_9GENT
MFNSVCSKTLHYARKCSVFSFSLAYKNLHFLDLHQPFSSSSIKNASNQKSVVVSYLMNSCGFSQERALSASKYVFFDTPKNADSVLVFLKKHEFSDDQISRLVKRRPPILLANPEKTLLPKIEFLKSIGVSRLDIPKIICKSPNILARSLKNHIIPAIDLLWDLLHSNEDIVFAINRFPELLVTNMETKVAPNLEILREVGVTKSGILYCLKHMPRLLVRSPDSLKEYVKRVEEIGFYPQTTMFLQAVKVMAATARLTWDRKMEVYKRCGWSEEEVLTAFRRQPHCMVASESKIMGVMDILVHKMGFHISDLAKTSVLILLSLNRTIIPRCSVYEVLHSKGLLTKNLSLTKCLVCPERLFIKNFVQRYEEEAPELLKLYQEKMQLSK